MQFTFFKRKGCSESVNFSVVCPPHLIIQSATRKKCFDFLHFCRTHRSSRYTYTYYSQDFHWCHLHLISFEHCTIHHWNSKKRISTLLKVTLFFCVVIQIMLLFFFSIPLVLMNILDSFSASFWMEIRSSLNRISLILSWSCLMCLTWWLRMWARSHVSRQNSTQNG